jgi:putative transposase
MTPKQSPLSSEERRAQIALERYTLILPILRAGSAKERHHLRKQLVASQVGEDGGLSLTTLYRWEKAWTQGGFEALKPQPRQEKKVARVVSTETLDRAEALKREQPFRSARAIINALQLDREQPIPEAKLSERTLRRHLAKRGATSAQLVAEQRPKPYRRFERHAFGDLWQGDALHGPVG